MLVQAELEAAILIILATLALHEYVQPIRALGGLIYDTSGLRDNGKLTTTGVIPTMSGSKETISRFKPS